MKAAVEQVFNGSIATSLTYDETKLTVTALLGQFNLGSGARDKFIGPNPIACARPAESALAQPASFVHPVKISADLFWVFYGDLATAAATRRVQLYTYVPSTGSLSLVGGIVLTFPGSGNVTTKGFRVLLNNYTTGTASAAGTAVTGTGTAWNTSLLCVGSRIGFGSTNPSAITTWYEISAVGSDLGITLTASAGTVADGPYVIQDLSIAHANTNATATNGGIFIAKGLRYENFAVSPTTIPAATTTDRIRAVYWLKDASTETNTAIDGCAIEDFSSWTSQFVYCADGAASNLKVYKYNLRASLTGLASGAQVLTGGDLVITGTQVVTGTIVTTNNGRVATLGHGPGSGVSCLYLLTTTRVLRAPVSGITAASTTFVADAMSEVPPGGTVTNTSGATFTAFDVAGSIDRLVILSAASTGTAYITQYRTDSGQFDRRFNSLTLQTDGAGADADSVPYPHSNFATTAFIWIEDGIMFWVAQVVTAGLNVVYAYPLAADFAYGTRIICPKMTLGATVAKLYRLADKALALLGGDTLGLSPEAHRFFYRTSGISDNTGGWTQVPDNGDLSGVAVASEIQFSVMFRTLGPVMVPPRLVSLALIYETADALPSQYRWNFSDSNATTGIFAWVQAVLFGGSLTTHTIDIYRADTNALVLSQASTGTTNGTFEYWTGAAWAAGLSTDTVGTRRRFNPTASLPAGVDLYAVVTVA